jgi:hypothetical protein
VIIKQLFFLASFFKQQACHFREPLIFKRLPLFPLPKQNPCRYRATHNRDIYDDIVRNSLDFFDFSILAEFEVLVGNRRNRTENWSNTTDFVMCGKCAFIGLRISCLDYDDELTGIWERNSFRRTLSATPSKSFQVYQSKKGACKNRLAIKI